MENKITNITPKTELIDKEINQKKQLKISLPIK